MSSVVKTKCWLCLETFSSAKELKNHAGSSKHSAMRVVCPWCFEEKHTYRTTAERLKHVDKRHKYVQDEMKKEDFFSERNGYWMALKPQDYKRVTKPTDYSSVVAIKTRSIMDGEDEDTIKKQRTVEKRM